jgi:hypothetical protein
VAYAQVGEVVLAGLDPADVAAALEAHAGGQSLATDDRFTTSFAHAGASTGSEFWVDLPSLLDASVGIIDPGSQLRDILHQIGDLAVRASAAGDHLEIHGVLTVR